MNRKTNIFLVAIVFLSIVAIGWFLMGAWWLHDLRHVDEELVITESGDKYIFRFITAAGHHAECKIIDASSGEEIADFNIGLPAKPPVVVLIDTPQLRCYAVNNNRSIIYQLSNKFGGIDIEKVRLVDPKDMPELVVVAKGLTSNRKWEWIKVFGEFLVKSNDEDTILLLERYAQGQFSSEEQEVNKNSGITQVYIQEMSKQILLQRYNK